MKKINYKSILIIVFCLLFIGSSFLMEDSGSEAKKINYTEFVQMANNQQVEVVYYVKDTKFVEFKDNKDKKYQFVNPNNDDFKLMLLEKNLKIEEPKMYSINSKINSIFKSILGLYPIAILYLFYKMMGSTFLKNNNEPIGENEIPDVEFKDIAGLKSVKKDLSFLIEFLQHPKKFEEKDVHMPSGMLLYGPPGTGKTMLAKAIAGEAKVPFFYTSGSNFVELYVGNGAKKVRELFEKARENTPCIIFIDEIDALGVKRKSDGSGGNQELNQTVNAFLAEIDGFDSTEGIFVIGATNRIDDLDPAFIRPGRFDKHICVPLPENKDERLELFNLYSKNKIYDDDVSLEYWSKQTVWFSGADIKTLINEAALKSVILGEEAISNKCLEDAFYEKATKGHRKERRPEEKKREEELVAWHESGHALISKILCKSSVPSVTIVSSTSGVGGFTLDVPDKTELLSKKDLMNEIISLYGGRIAEELLTGDSNQITIGASNDIEVSTKYIQDMVKIYGMSKYGMLNLQIINYDKDKEVLKEMQKISEDCYQIGYNFLKENLDLLKACASLLIEKETINENELEKLIKNYKKDEK